MKRAIFIPLLVAMFFLSSCAFTNLFTKNLLEQRRHSFVGLTKIILTPEKQMVGMATASGAVIGHAEKFSYILTAKHFCDEEAKGFIDVIQAHTQKSVSVETEVIAKSIEMDACIMKSPRLPVRAIKMANFKPDIGEKVYNLAAPQGVFGEDLIMLFEGFYSGVLKSDGIYNPDADIYSLPANPGSSGSPIINSRGMLVGMVWAIHSRFHHITLSVPFGKLKKFINNTLPKR
jgi:S1-C subfamily serine protease